jgi:hypothetical protein
MSPVSGSAPKSDVSLAVLSDRDYDTNVVSLFSPTNMRSAGTIPAGTQVTVLAPSGLSGYILVMTAKGEVFEVWHGNLMYLSRNNRSKSTLN